MKKPSFKLKSMLLSFLTLLGFLSVVFSSVTYAKYVFGKKTQQSAYGLGGERYVSIFFNANIWAQGKDSSGNIIEANYYLYAWHHTDPSTDTLQTIIAPSAHVNPTISSVKMDLYVFEYDTTKHNRFLFVRWNPSIVPSIDIAHGDGKGNWNQTIDITYSSSVNYYCIDDWGTLEDPSKAESATNPKRATPTTNMIVKNPSTGDLSWGQ